MNKLNLSKSRYCKCVQCPKILWLKEYKKEEEVPSEKDAVFKNGRIVGELAKGLFGKYEDIEYNKNLNIMIRKTNEVLKNKSNIITEASFNYNNNFCSVDILKNDIDGVEIYEVKSSTKLEDIFIDDVSYQYYVLSSLGYNVKKAALVHINKEYIRGEELELDKLFKIEDLTNIAISKKEEIENNISEFNKFMQIHSKDNEPNIDIGMKCTEPYMCDFWNYCIKKLPKPNVFDIGGGMHRRNKFQKYYEGKISFKDLITENLNPKYIEQIDFELNNLEPKIDKEAIKKVLDSLKYPLYFIDYETYQTSIPKIKGTKPYEQLPFQYSLHIIKEKGAPIEHKEFLAEIDDKDFIRHFAESMIKDIQENGSVIIYNKSFEPARNREIATLYPDLAEELERINGNIVDFMEVFKRREYYMKEMHGSASIKDVLPALYPDDTMLDYHGLPVVHNGTEASDAFISLEGKTKEEQEKIRHGLLLYCELDTFAMVKLWERFKEIVGEK